MGIIKHFKKFEDDKENRSEINRNLYSVAVKTNWVGSYYTMGPIKFGTAGPDTSFLFLIYG